MIKYFNYFMPVLLAFLVSCNNPSPDKQYRIVGYVAGFRDFDFETIDASKLTHINYAFANIIDGEVRFGSESIDNRARNSDDISKLIDLKKVNPDLKVLVSVGGWGWSGNFSDAALTDSSRNRFAASAAQFIKDYRLDGIDLDWEYPNQPGAGNIYRPEDVHNFTLLLKCVRQYIDALTLQAGRKEPYLLSIATGGDSVYVANTELGEASKYLDFINIMSYDLHNGLTYQSGHHSNLWLSAYDAPNGDATVRAVNMHLEAGVSPAKLNIGIPFYGRIWRGVEPVNNGLYREARTTGAGIPYTEVLKAAADPGYVRLYDSSAAAPYLWNASDSIFISYDDETSIAAKMQYVKSEGLGGVMFWEYAEDVNGRLLNAIVKGLGSGKEDKRD
jgi:chitinase